jgi:UDP-N-acetyl-D-mannosaminuronate dehydrogenase
MRRLSQHRAIPSVVPRFGETTVPTGRSHLVLAGADRVESVAGKGGSDLATTGVVVVAGMGEVGRPLLRVLSERFECVGVDIHPVDIGQPCSVMHVCYPFQISDFIGRTVGYVNKYQPALTIINSTVAPGTTRKVQEAVRDRAVAYSPVRGKHARMEADMLRYKRFVAALRPDALQHALDHFHEAGFRTATFKTLEIAEISKLIETTYLGILIAWAQETERFAAAYDGSFEEVKAFIEEIDFLPSHIFPGYIGGHCVIPNITILQTQFKSKFLDAIMESNELKQQQLLTVVGGQINDQSGTNRIGVLGPESRPGA